LGIRSKGRRCVLAASEAGARLVGVLDAIVDRKRLGRQRHEVGPKAEPDVMAQPFLIGASGAPRIGAWRRDRFALSVMMSP
jgi:hypothetical protein